MSVQVPVPHLAALEAVLASPTMSSTRRFLCPLNLRPTAGVRQGHAATAISNRSTCTQSRPTPAILLCQFLRVLLSRNTRLAYPSHQGLLLVDTITRARALILRLRRCLRSLLPILLPLRTPQHRTSLPSTRAPANHLCGRGCCERSPSPSARFPSQCSCLLPLSLTQSICLLELH